MTIQYIRDNGKMIIDKDSEFQCGKMARDMKDPGWMTNFMAKDHIILMKAIYIKDNFIMEKPTGKVCA